MKINWLEETYYGHMYNHFQSEETYYIHFTTSKFLTAMYDTDDEILSFKLGIIEDEIEKDHPAYWGWKEKGEEDICMIYSFETAFDACFAYGYETAVKRGEGEVVRLQIEQIKEKESDD